METLNRFYTYAYLRVDRTPYYIGKGSGRRWCTKGNCEVKPPKDKSRIIILKQNLIEEEEYLKFKEKRQQVINAAIIGSLGRSTYKFSESTFTFTGEKIIKCLEFVYNTADMYWRSKQPQEKEE